MKNLLFILMLSVLSAFIFSCSENDVVPEDELSSMRLVAEKQLSGTELGLEIYSENDTLIAGYNRFFFRLTKNGTSGSYNNATITVAPLMDMGEMTHAAPVENPVYNTEKSRFEGAVVFVMPSTGGSWNLTVSVTDNENEQSAAVDVPVEVALAEESRLVSFIHNSNKYFISLVEPSSPKVGVNDFEIAVHKKAGMMDWPAVDEFTFTIEPEMPTMDHGSPNNVNPVNTGNGHYKGKVNFTMDGYWKVNINAAIDGAEVQEDLFFDITFSAKSSL